jgi:hypothetical protein
MSYSDFRRASSSSLNRDELDDLSRSDDEFIRSAVALNPLTSESTLAMLSQNEDGFVLECLKQRPTWVLPKLVKSQTIAGKVIRLRPARIADAEFIVELRTNEKKSRHISRTSSDVSSQQNWLEQNLKDDGQVYFIIEDLLGNSFGTVRIYDVVGHSFCWGSWVLSDTSPKTAAIESAILIYQFALECGFLMAHFDVRKANTSVCKFHERFGAKKMYETEADIYYMISATTINSSLVHYRKFLKP